MFRFELNDNLKQYIKEVDITKNKVDIVRDYMRELEYECDITISIYDFKMVLPGFLVIPDWEAKCFRITRNDKALESDATFKLINDILDLNNHFNIPFNMVLEGHVLFITTWYGHMNITDRFVELIEQAYGDMTGYRYEFIKEAWINQFHDIIYDINGTLYTAYLTSFGDNPVMSLRLEECQTGQSHHVTAMELLRGKYSYVHELKKTDDGLYIPRLRHIKKYESTDKINPKEIVDDIRFDKCMEE